MSSFKMFDFHSHNTIKPYHTTDGNGNFPNPDHWNEPEYEHDDAIYHKIIDAVYPEIAIRAQSHLKAYHKGNVKCFSPSLYPIEHGFIRSRIIVRIAQHLASPLTRLLRLFKKADWVVPFTIRRAVSAVIGMDPKKFKHLRQRGFNYYDDLVGEYMNLSQQTSVDVNGTDISIEFPTSFEELENIDFDCKLVGLPSIEGAHSFISTTNIPKLKKRRRLENTKKHYDEIADVAVANVLDFKKKCPSLLYVTFAHHFYNSFCGHTSSLPAIAFNQGKKYYNEGINANGWRMIQALLDRQSDAGSDLPRILIDTKHMSFQSRVEYHDYVQTKRAAGDKIPIIQTHTGVSGRNSIRDLKLLIEKQEILRVQYAETNNLSIDNTESKNFWKEPIYFENVSKQSGQFVNSALNLFDDEIVEIIDSDGLIGIMLDEKRIMGKEFPSFVSHSQYTLINTNGSHASFRVNDRASYKKAKRKLGRLLFDQKYGFSGRGTSGDPDITTTINHERQRIQANIDSIRNALSPILCGVFLNQIFYIVNVYHSSPLNSSKNPWDHVCIGTDFDGVINPLDAYPTGAFMENFGNDVVAFWKSKITTAPELAQHFGATDTPEILMEKIFWGNSWNWLRRYFSKKYRFS